MSKIKVIIAKGRKEFLDIYKLDLEKIGCICDRLTDTNLEVCLPNCISFPFSITTYQLPDEVSSMYGKLSLIQTQIKEQTLSRIASSYRGLQCRCPITGINFTASDTVYFAPDGTIRDVESKNVIFAKGKWAEKLTVSEKKAITKNYKKEVFAPALGDSMRYFVCVASNTKCIVEVNLETDEFFTRKEVIEFLDSQGYKHMTITNIIEFTELDYKKYLSK